MINGGSKSLQSPIPYSHGVQHRPCRSTPGIHVRDLQSFVSAGVGKMTHVGVEIAEGLGLHACTPHVELCH